MEPQPVDYAAVLADLEQRKADLERAIAAVRMLQGLPPVIQTNGEGSLGTPIVPEAKLGSDAFFGMNISAAAQKYLSIRKKPATSPEIAAALEQGGFPHRSANLANTINSVLLRNTQGASPVFAKVKRGTWGLRAWYPNYRPKDDKDDE